MAFDLRQVLNGATIRAIAGIRDVGEVVMGYVSDPDGGEVHDIAEDKTDVYVKVIDAMSGLPIIGRLFVPGNILWRLPPKDDSAVVVRAGDTGGPGAAVVMHGDGGANTTVPPWLDAQNSGIYVPEGFHLESTKDQMVITSNSGGTPSDITLSKDGTITITSNSGGTAASVTLDKSGTVALKDKSNTTLTLDGNGNVTVSVSGTQVLKCSATSVALGLVGTLPVLVQGSFDSMGVPVTQFPGASASIVKAG